MKFRSKLKVLKVGPQIEVYRFSKPVKVGGSKTMKMPRLCTNQTTVSRHSEYTSRSSILAMNKIRYYVLHNFNSRAKFLTLTFKDTKKFDIHSISETYQRFYCFILKLKKLYDPNLKYICVPEFQDKFDRGALHFHFISNLRFINVKELERVWGHGFIWIKPMHNNFGAALYLSKYLTKNYLDARFKGYRKYRKSNNLSLPIPYYSNDAIKIIKNRIGKGDAVRFISNYYNPYLGFTNYSVIRKQKK